MMPQEQQMEQVQVHGGHHRRQIVEEET